MIYTAIMLVVLVWMGHTHSSLKYTGRDMVWYNEKKQMVEQELYSGTSVEQIEEQYDCDILKLYFHFHQ